MKVKLLLTKGAYVNAMNSKMKETALIEACLSEKESIEMVDLLLNAGADPWE